MVDTLPKHGLAAPVFDALAPDGDMPPLPSGPFVLAAVTGGSEARVREACANAVRYTRRDGSEWKPTADLSLRELDYAFNEFGWFVTRVGTFGGTGPTLSEWAETRCHPGVFFYLETFPDGPEGASRTVAVRDGQLVSVDDPGVVAVAEAAARAWPVGQVFMVTPASNIRWAN